MAPYRRRIFFSACSTRSRPMPTWVGVTIKVLPLRVTCNGVSAWIPNASMRGFSITRAMLLPCFFNVLIMRHLPYQQCYTMQGVCRQASAGDAFAEVPVVGGQGTSAAQRAPRQCHDPVDFSPRHFQRDARVQEVGREAYPLKGFNGEEDRPGAGQPQAKFRPGNRHRIEPPLIKVLQRDA